MASKLINSVNVNGGKCFVCGQPGHLVKACPSKSQKQGARKNKIDCFRCGKNGHIAKNCSTKCYNCEKVGNLAKNCTTKCYNCGKLGHLSKNCRTKKAVNKKTEHRPSFIQVASNGEGLRTCDREVKKGEVTRTGLVI